MFIRNSICPVHMVKFLYDLCLLGPARTATTRAVLKVKHILETSDELNFV